MPLVLRIDRVVFEMRECLAKGHLDWSLVSSDFSYKHRTLHSCNAEVGQPLFIRIFSEMPLRLLADKERCELVFYELDDQAYVLPNEFVFFGELVGDGPDRATTSHAEAHLPIDMRMEPLLHVLPGIDLVLNWSRARFYCF